MYYTTDPAERSEFIASLRALADYLETHRGTPVPLTRETIILTADRLEDGGAQQVNCMARRLHVKAETTPHGHRAAFRSFGRIGYEILSISEAAMADYEALTSYWGCITA
jgi:hypothetical protein